MLMATAGTWAGRLPSAWHPVVEAVATAPAVEGFCPVVDGISRTRCSCEAGPESER
jgi:hypothetical protein